MGTTDREKPQTAPPRPVTPAAAVTPRYAAAPPVRTGAAPAAGATAERRASAAPSVSEGLESSFRALAAGAAGERRSYFKMAFTNPYNLSLLGGGLTAALLTADPLLAVGTLALEALWLLFAPDSQRLRHILWDPRFDQLKRALDAQVRARRTAGLSEEARGRIDTLVARQDQIRTLAAENPSFAGDLMKAELVKTDRLVDAFIEMAATCARYEAYLASVDPAALTRDQHRFEAEVASASASDDAAQAGIAKRNLAVVTKRAERLQEIRRYLSVARGQLDLIENSFQLIADQIVTMQSPQELSGQLDDLLDGVEAVRETTRETEQLLGGSGSIERTL